MLWLSNFARKLSAFVINANRNILLIDNRDSFTYNLVQAFEELGCFVEVSSEYTRSINSIPKYNHIVFSPGPGLPEDFPIMFDILKVIHRSTKVLGICLGHQAIAQFYGATLFRQAFVQHGQRKRILNLCHNPKSALFKMPKEFEAGLYHSWAVDEQSIPDSISITCMSEDGIIMGVCHNDLPVEGIQFHPESFLTKSGPELLKNWLAL